MFEGVNNLTATAVAVTRALKFLLTALRAIGPFDLHNMGSCVNTCTVKQQGRLELSCSFTNVKDKYRIFYMVKGHLNATHSTVVGSYDGYFRRMWNNNEAYLHEDGFEHCWQQLLLKEKQQ